MVTYAEMPATMLLCLRMAFAAAALGVVVAGHAAAGATCAAPGARSRVLGISVAWR